MDTTERAHGVNVLPWAVLAIGLVTSLILFVIIRENIEDAAAQRFEHLTVEARQSIEARVQSYADVLYGGRALFDTYGVVSRDRFHQFVKSLDLANRYPGLEVMNYAAHVLARDRDRFEDAVRGDTSLDPAGYPRFAIRPPGERPEYHVLVYLEPMVNNEFAFGLDIASNPASSNPKAGGAAARSMRDSGKLSASGRLLRVMRAKEIVGLAMRLPVYRSGAPLDTVQERRAAYLGSIGAGIVVENLMKGALPAETARRVRFSIYDVDPARDRPVSRPGDDRLLFDSNQLIPVSPVPPAADDPRSTFTRVLPMEFAGRSWEIHFSAPKGAIVDRIDALLPWIVLAGGLLSSALLFGVVHTLASSRRRAIGIAQEITTDLRSHAERLRSTSRRLVEIQETERRVLASELHDRALQNLTAIGVNLSRAANCIQADAKPELAALLEDSASLLRQTFDTMRDVMSELRPQVLDDFGLLAALRFYAGTFSRRTGVRVDFDVDGCNHPQLIPKAVELAMFRIAQEALNNVAKHSRAARVEITLACASERAALAIRDDGVGFDPERIKRSNPETGWGLMIMRERAEAAGARFELEAIPGSGVRVLVECRFQAA